MLRIFFLTSTPPIPTWGGAMAFHRHFVELPGLQVHVATDNPQVLEHRVSYPVTLLSTPPTLLRLQRTRLASWAHAWQHFSGRQSLPAHVLLAAREFKPDAVLTVAGSWSWTAEMAAELARELDVPLVASFNDWFDYNLILPKCLHAALKRRFRKLYRECDLALCTSEGMKEELGPHDHAIIHYPCGAQLPPSVPAPGRTGAPRVLYGGNLGEWYGPMVESVITAFDQMETPNLEFVICGANPNWTLPFAQQMAAGGRYLGQVAFPRLQECAQSSDLLLLPMGFDPAQSLIERTSFKTKFLDYLSFDRPILVWGPAYSSAVRTARVFDSAEVVDTEDPTACLAALRRLAGNPSRQAELRRNARRMYEDRFNPGRIHANLLSYLHATCHRRTRRLP